MTPLEVLAFVGVAGLGNYRLRKLITYDVITEKFRDEFRHVEEDNGDYYYVPNDNFFAKLLFCDRCVGLWIAIIQVIMALTLPNELVLWIFALLAVAAIGDIIYQKLVGDEDAN